MGGGGGRGGTYVTLQHLGGGGGGVGGRILHFSTICGNSMDEVHCSSGSVSTISYCMNHEHNIHHLHTEWWMN